MNFVESNADIIVVSIIPKLELQAIIKEFSKKWPTAEIKQLPGSTTLFKVTTKKAWVVRIAVRAIYEAGNLNSAIETTNLLARFFPRFAFLCGIAGNLNHDKRKLGDVVVSGSYAYKQYTRMSSGRKLEATMPNGPAISRQMLDKANSHFGSSSIDFSGDDVAGIIDGSSSSAPVEVEVGKIFCWDMVLDCDDTRIELIGSDREYRAVEMELYGFLKSMQAFGDLHNHPIDGLAFRGLSDPASGKGASDGGKKNWRAYSARNAARALADFIDGLAETDAADTRF